MKVKVESEKVGLKLNIQKTKIMASRPTTSWVIDGETVETVSGVVKNSPANAGHIESITVREDPACCRATKLMASGPIISWQIDGELGFIFWLYFSGLQNHCRW